jgi:hypothetical protein
MRAAILTLLIAGSIVSTGLGASPQPAASPDQNAWRYVWHNGAWWYWLPQQKWVYWQSNHWNDYNPPAFASIPGQSGYGAASDNSDIRPFYGHAESRWGYGDVGARNSRIRPFYGHALPQEEREVGLGLSCQPVSRFAVHIRSQFEEGEFPRHVRFVALHQGNRSRVTW